VAVDGATALPGPMRVVQSWRPVSPSQGVEPADQRRVCGPVRQGVWGQRLVGALDRFAFGFCVCAGVDLSGKYVGVAEQVEDADQVDAAFARVHRDRAPDPRAR